MLQEVIAPLVIVVETIGPNSVVVEQPVLHQVEYVVILVPPLIAEQDYNVVTVDVPLLAQNVVGGRVNIAQLVIVVAAEE